MVVLAALAPRGAAANLCGLDKLDDRYRTEAALIAREAFAPATPDYRGAGVLGAAKSLAISTEASRSRHRRRAQRPSCGRRPGGARTSSPFEAGCGGISTLARWPAP